MQPVTFGNGTIFNIVDNNKCRTLTFTNEKLRTKHGLVTAGLGWAVHSISGRFDGCVCNERYHTLPFTSLNSLLSTQKLLPNFNILHQNIKFRSEIIKKNQKQYENLDQIDIPIVSRVLVCKESFWTHCILWQRRNIFCSLRPSCLA